MYLAGVFAVSTGASYLGQVTDVNPSTTTIIIGVLIGGAVGAAGIWVTYTVVVYLATAVVGGSGTISRAAANVGWGLLPLFVVNACYSVFVWTLYLSGLLPTISPTTMQAPIWLRLLNMATTVLGFLWIGYVLTYAIEDARNVSRKHATIIAGLVAAGGILVSVASAV